MPRSRYMLGLLFLLSACSIDVSRTVNVAPSAQGQEQAIQAAVDALNAKTGAESFTAWTVDSGKRIDGEIVVRQDADGQIGPEQKGKDSKTAGETQPTRFGVVVTLIADAPVRLIAHELGHAAGLEHVSDPGNLMYPSALPGEWTLTEEQIDRIR